MERTTAQEFLQELKELDLVQYLASLGHYPAKPIQDHQVWYHSPLHADRTPSFKVDTRQNCWYDHSEGVGGNLVDFAILYHNCTVGEFMSMMRANSIHLQLPHRQEFRGEKLVDKSIIITRERPLFKYPLLNYIKDRRVDIQVADKYCKEVEFSINKKAFYGIGFPNRSGGFEIRNSLMKCASMPKDITHVNNGSKSIHVFEGFFDFLTFATIFKNHPQAEDDFLILNGTSLRERAVDILASYSSKNLYLDNDPTGDRTTYFLSSSAPGCVDLRKMYKGYNDLNAWHCTFGSQNMAQSPKKKDNGHKLTADGG